MAKQIRNATLMEQAVGRHKCEDCGKELRRGERITFTTDMRLYWHTACFDANLTRFKYWPKSK